MIAMLAEYWQSNIANFTKTLGGSFPGMNQMIVFVRAISAFDSKMEKASDHTVYRQAVKAIWLHWFGKSISNCTMTWAARSKFVVLKKHIIQYRKSRLILLGSQKYMEELQNDQNYTNPTMYFW